MRGDGSRDLGLGRWLGFWLGSRSSRTSADEEGLGGRELPNLPTRTRRSSSTSTPSADRRSTRCADTDRARLRSKSEGCQPRGSSRASERRDEARRQSRGIANTRHYLGRVSGHHFIPATDPSIVDPIMRGRSADRTKVPDRNPENLTYAGCGFRPTASEGQGSPRSQSLGLGPRYSYAPMSGREPLARPSMSRLALRTLLARSIRRVDAAVGRPCRSRCTRPTRLWPRHATPRSTTLETALRATLQT